MSKITKATNSPDAILVEATKEDCVQSLLDLLDHKPEDVAQITILSSGIIRVQGADRTMRTHRFTWPVTLQEAE